jgi:hypothetical protein
MMVPTCITLDEYKKEALIAVSILQCIITVNNALELYSWYVESPTIGISNPLPMLF